MDQLVCPLWCPSWKGTPLWDAYIPWRLLVSLWHLSPPLFACVNSSDLFTFTVFPFPDLESAEDSCWWDLEVCQSMEFMNVFILQLNHSLRTLHPFCRVRETQQQCCTQRSSCVDAVLCIYATSSVSIFIGTCLWAWLHFNFCSFFPQTTCILNLRSSGFGSKIHCKDLMQFPCRTNVCF